MLKQVERTLQSAAWSTSLESDIVQTSARYACLDVSKIHMYAVLPTSFICALSTAGAQISMENRAQNGFLGCEELHSSAFKGGNVDDMLQYLMRHKMTQKDSVSPRSALRAELWGE